MRARSGTVYASSEEAFLQVRKKYLFILNSKLTSLVVEGEKPSQSHSDTSKK